MSQTYRADSNLQATQEWLGQAKAISASLASSPSQNEARRRDVADLLQKVVSDLTAFANKLKPFSFEQAQNFAAPIQKSQQLAGQAVLQKQLSWAQIDSSLAEIITSLEIAKKEWINRVEKESQALVAGIKQQVDAFQPQELNDAAWAQIDTILSQANIAAEKANSFPLAPLQPWNAKLLIQEQLTALDGKVASISGPVATQVESITQQIGLPPQSGRKAVVWADKHKVYLMLAAIGLIALRLRA